MVFTATAQDVPTEMTWNYSGPTNGISFNIRHYDPNIFFGSIITNVLTTNASFVVEKMTLVSITVSNSIEGSEHTIGLGPIHRTSFKNAITNQTTGIVRLPSRIVRTVTATIIE